MKKELKSKKFVIYIYRDEVQRQPEYSYEKEGLITHNTKQYHFDTFEDMKNIIFALANPTFCTKHKDRRGEPE